ncbi:MAG: hypothetical protein A2V88_15685 [Elusimicrobia bacterium RBG_16_66_12]|nr:MAG: hypothetical protein A2V88_15685 [Elusimicrobia bacterium RBG_16_66_12]
MISVVIAARDCEREIRVLLESILVSEFKDLQLCVCDDASTDGTRGAIRSFEERLDISLVVNDRNLGVCRSRNKALALARGDLLLFLDADIRLYPDTITKLLRTLERTGADVVDGCYSPVALDDGLFSRYYALFSHHSFLVGERPCDYNVFNAWCALCRPEVMKKTGGHLPLPKGVEIENEALGRRIVAQGFSLMLDPGVAVDHHWGGHAKLVFIFTRRVYWWVKIFFATGGGFEKSMTTASYGFGTLCLPAAALASLASRWEPFLLWPAAALAAGFAAAYAPFYLFVLKREGVVFCGASVLLSAYFACYAAAGAVCSCLDECRLLIARRRGTLDPRLFGAGARIPRA